MAEKLDYQVTYGSTAVPVKARVFKGVDGQHYANIHGDLFNDCELSADRIDQLISILQDVVTCIRRGGK